VSIINIIKDLMIHKINKGSSAIFNNILYFMALARIHFKILKINNNSNIL